MIDRSNSTTTNPPDIADAVTAKSTLLVVEQYMSIYGPLVLTTLGIIGNVLSILIFLSPRYRRQSSHFYLLSLALSDLCFLIINLIEDTFRNHNQLYQSRINILDRSSTMICILVEYARNTTRLLSSWIIVAFTIERLLVVFYPLKRQIICRRKIARGVVLLLFVTSLLININVPFHYGIIKTTLPSGEEDTICDILPGHRQVYMRFAIASVLMVYLVPMCTIGIVNMLICCQLWNRSLLTEENDNELSTDGRSPTKRSGRLLTVFNILSCFHSSSSSALKNNGQLKASRKPSITQNQSSRPLIAVEANSAQGHNGPCTSEPASQLVSRTLSSQSSSSPGHNKQSSASVKTHIQSRANRVTVTLLLVSCSFLLLNTPYCAVWAANYIQGFSNETWRSIKEITELFMLTNFCINFLLYCVSGKLFRDELKHIVRCEWKELYKKQEGAKQARPKLRIELQETTPKLRPMNYVHRNARER